MAYRVYSFRSKLLLRCETMRFEDNFSRKGIKHKGVQFDKSSPTNLCSRYWDVRVGTDAFEILTGELYFTDWISGMTLFISES